MYRLLTRGTLEERIMGLQRFKLDIANAVVNTDNASLADMDTGQILDLFAPQQPNANHGKPAAAAAQQGVVSQRLLVSTSFAPPLTSFSPLLCREPVDCQCPTGPFKQAFVQKQGVGESYAGLSGLVLLSIHI